MGKKKKKKKKKRPVDQEAEDPVQATEDNL